MKKTYPFILISLLTISGSCFAVGDKKFIEQFLRDFKKLPISEQVERMANARLVDGYIESIPDLASAFEKHPGKKRELYELAHKLRPQIMEHCWERLNDTSQQFLRAFSEQPVAARRDIIFQYGDDNRLQVFMLPEEQKTRLESMVEDQRESFYVFATLLQMKDVTVHREHEMEEPAAPLPSAPAAHSKLSRLLHKAKALVATKA